MPQSQITRALRDRFLALGCSGSLGLAGGIGQYRYRGQNRAGLL